MAVGSSGRIVVEVEPEIKQELYVALEREGLTLKKWFLKNAHKFLYEDKQLSLDFTGQTSSAYERVTDYHESTVDRENSNPAAKGE